MEAELEKAVESGKLSPADANALRKLPPGAFCLHKSWGFGQIASIDFLLNQVNIHFGSKRDHSMQLEYAAQSLAPIDADHILARKASDLEGVRREAREEPLTVMRSLLKSFGGAATPDQISQTLSGDVFTPAEFKKWWEAAKKALKKDGHFYIGSKRTEPIALREAPVSRADELLEAFDAARQLKQQIAALDQIARNADSFGSQPEHLQAVIERAGREARRNQRLKTVEAFELIGSRDEICKQAGIEPPAEAPRLGQMLREEEKQLRDILNNLAASKQKRVLGAFPRAFGDEWVSKALRQMLDSGNVRIVAEVARLLQEQGKHEDLRAALDRWIREHSVTSEILYWLCKERKGEFSDLVVPQVFSAIITALERDQLSESKRSGKLHDLLMDDRELIPDLLRDAEPGEARDSMRRFIMTPVFEELNKRSLLARIVKTHPELQSMLGAGEEEKQEALIVSWESLEKRKAQHEELVNKKIPENTKEISVARSYGDLRENFEFKAAKEMQRVLTRQKSDLERDLNLARGTAFENPDTTQASIGTVVTVRNTASGETTRYTILGAWDSDPENHVISYKTQIAQTLIGHTVGHTVTLPAEVGEKTVEILSIEAYRAVAAQPL